LFLHLVEPFSELRHSLDQALEVPLYFLIELCSLSEWGLLSHLARLICLSAFLADKVGNGLPAEFDERGFSFADLASCPPEELMTTFAPRGLDTQVAL
jgi:hypothetical protein